MKDKLKIAKPALGFFIMLAVAPAYLAMMVTLFSALPISKTGWAVLMVYIVIKTIQTCWAAAIYIAETGETK